MHRNARHIVLALMMVAAVVRLAAASEPPPPKTAPVTLPDAVAAWTVDGGGGYAAGGDLEVEATIGQPDAGLRTGGGMALDGGFWGRLLDQGEIFRDGFETGDTSRWSATSGGTP